MNRIFLKFLTKIGDVQYLPRPTKSSTLQQNLQFCDMKVAVSLHSSQKGWCWQAGHLDYDRVGGEIPQ